MTISSTFAFPVLAFAGVLTLAACGGAPEAAAPASSSPADAASQAPVSVPVSPASAQPSVSSGRAASAPASAASTQSGAVKLTLADSGSQMDIKMRELLAGNAAQTEAVESTKAVTGSIMLDSQGNVLPGSAIKMDLTTLKSDRDIRDNFIKRVTLQTNQFPVVEFMPNQIQGLDGGLPTSGQRAFKLIGDATVKGKTSRMTWDVTANFDQQGAKGQASTQFKLSDFGLTPPKAGPVISVDDNGSIVLTFQAARAAA